MTDLGAPFIPKRGRGRPPLPATLKARSLEELIRAQALEEAAKKVEAFRMPRDGDGPVLLLEVLTALARKLREMK